MNHLAHLFLSGENKYWLTGNFITDFLTPAQQKSLSQLYQDGIRIHLFIDRTIDNDPVYKESIALTRMSQGKYAPVVTDIYYDYFLSHFWNEFSITPMEDFIKHTYSALLEHIPENIPNEIKQRLHFMVERDFLRSYTALDYMGNTFALLSKRLHFKHNLPDAVGHFKKNFELMKNQFDQTWPKMVEECLKFRLNLQN